MWETPLCGKMCVRDPLCNLVDVSPCTIWLDDRGTGQWKWMEEVPRRTSLVPLAFPSFLHWLIRVETEGLLEGRGRHFHCTVEPSPGHIRCQVSVLFYFFCSGEGKGESEAPGRGGGLLKIPRGGGGAPRRGGGGCHRVCEGPGGSAGNFFWGGAKYFFRGRNSHQGNTIHPHRNN